MTELTADSFRTIDLGSPIADNEAVPYYLADLKRRIAVVRVDGVVYAFDDLCTCADEPCPLSGGLLTGTTLMCQCHGSQFDLSTGFVLRGPATVPLKVYDVEEAGGDMRIRA